MPIQISSQPMILAWNRQNASLEYSKSAQQTLDIQTTKPQIEIQTTKPQIQIDQSQSFADANLKNITAFRADANAYSQEILASGIDRIVSQGNDFINIHIKSDPIPDHAVYNAFEMFEKSFNYGVMPQSRPEISVIRGSVDITFNRGEVINQTTPQKVDFSYTPWKMEYYIKQYASISFRYEPPQFKLSV